MEKELILTPIMSEKAYGLSQVRNTYVFAVPHEANKHTVARAVSAQYEVTVTTVNVANIQGKAKRTVRKNGRVSKGRQSDTRKAYVTLKAGDSIPIFAALEEQAVQAEKAEKRAEKAIAKSAAKEKK
jgi:large subunit ribosomal protein L23